MVPVLLESMVYSEDDVLRLEAEAEDEPEAEAEDEPEAEAAMNHLADDVDLVHALGLVQQVAGSVDRDQEYVVHEVLDELDHR